jgi:hypothetical protein
MEKATNFKNKHFSKKEQLFVIIIFQENLKEIKDKVWVLKECLTRYGETYEQNLILLEFGLAFTDDLLSSSQLKASLSNNAIQLGSSSTSSSFMNDPKVERWIALTRWIFLHYLERLTAWNIISVSDEGFNLNEFKRFRDEDLEIIAIDYASKMKFDALIVY